MPGGDAAEQAASIFARSRKGGRRIEQLPPACRPRTLADAYAIQDAFGRLWGETVGFKVGCASKESQAAVGASGPIAGRIFSSACFESPARVSASDFHLLGVEAEFAFVMERDLPPCRTAYTRDEIAGWVASVRPVIEICDTGLADWRTAGVEHVVADNALHGGLVLGAAVTDWRGLDLAEHEVELAIDGIARGRGAGKLVLGHPLDAATWLANDLARRDIALKAGDIIAAGTCTGLHLAGPGTHVAASFGSLGQIELMVKP